MNNLSYTQSLPPKYQLRAVWVASVTNIDWPTTKFLTPAQQREEIITLLDRHKQNGMNCIMLQVRPSCDAFYYSEIEPWSEWLTGEQGLAPNPAYDPLPFWLTEAHKRGIEVHAWFNPYRAVFNKNSSSVSNSHISKTHPEWICVYDVLKVLNPGIPDVRAYDTKVILDVVKRYDIDGVHFDDYFYPYPKTGITFPDSVTFAAYGSGFNNINDWRRNNVNALISMLSDSIKHYKKHVKFGISPFGIWRNSSTDSLGSGTAGLQSYDAIYADSRKWVQSGWLDYINPQVYWYIGYNIAAYDTLVNWWAKNSFGRHVYVGEAAYKINSGGNWNNLSEMPNHLRYVSQIPQIKGNVYFSSKSITNNFGGFQDSLRNNFYKYPSLTPPMPWLDSIAPNKIENLVLLKDSNKVKLSWTKPLIAQDGDSAKRFVIYRFNHPDSIDLNDPRPIRRITWNDTTEYTDVIPSISNPQYIYAVTSLDKLNNESEPVIKSLNVTDVENENSQKLEFALQQNFPNPFNPETKIIYQLSENSKVSLKIYDILGNEIVELVNKENEAGRHEVIFDASKLPSGIYIYRINAGKFYSTKKMILVK